MCVLGRGGGTTVRNVVKSEETDQSVAPTAAFRQCSEQRGCRSNS